MSDNQSYRKLTDAEFEAEFKPQQNHLDSNASWSGWGYETYGPELEYVQQLAPTGRVWTVVDSEDGDGTVIVSGMHFVNRLLFIVTEHPVPEGQNIEVIDN
jgi:hypothetical protein